MINPRHIIHVPEECSRRLLASAELTAEHSLEESMNILVASEQRFRALFESVAEGVVIIGEDYIIRDVNDRLCEMSGFTRDELVGSTCERICGKADFPQSCPFWVNGGLKSAGSDSHLRCQSGEMRPVLKNASVIHINDRPYVCESMSDISYIKDVELELRRSNRELKGILETAPIGIALLRERKVVECNDRCAEMLGFAPPELLGMDVRELYPDTELLADLINSSESRVISEEMSLCHRNGSKVVAVVTVNIFLNDESRPADVLITMLDITERHKTRQSILRQAYYDTLTGLPNRAYILKELEQCIAADKEVSLILFDLNKFKDINDNYGHLAGDTLLQQVAESLRGYITEPDFIGRLGGDEFIIIVHTREREKLESFCSAICELISERCALKAQSVRVSASLGVVSEADNVNDYLLRADLAMYEAKGMSKRRPHGAYKFFTPSMLMSHEIQAQMKNMLLAAFENDEFDVDYQPVYNINTMTIEGVEALLHWEHPEYGEVAPEVLVPIADDTGVLVPIGHWVLNKVGATLSSLQQQVPQLRETGFYISINMTLQQLSDPDLINVFTRMLCEHNITGEMIMIDITDTAALDKSKWSFNIIKHLKQHGVRISINDFGIGYSALSTVERSSINNLKIDRSYISRLQNEKNMEITKAIINLAKALNLSVIAGGVENLEQFRMVRELECDSAQGSYLNKPLNCAELHELTYNLYV